MDMVRVQSLAAEFMSKDHVPEEFIRYEKDQPGITTFYGDDAPDIPIVDLGDPDQENVVRAIVEASKEFGIFQVVNHGIPKDVMEKLERAGKEFFELPQEEKEEYAIKTGAESLEGYGTKLQKDLEGKKSWLDFLFRNIWPPSRINYSVWPKNPPTYREANEEYAKYIKIVVDSILSSLSLGIGLNSGVIKEALGGEDLEFLLKINYYPPCPRPDLALGVVAHTDMSALTVIVRNEVWGLQVFKDDIWFDVRYIPNALIVHIGDQIEILSNEKYKAPLHRTTVNKEKAKMSWPVFCCPPSEMVVSPLS